MPHRATFLANDGVFDNKRAGTGQNRRHLQKTASGQQGADPTALPPARRLCRPGQPGPTNSLARVEQPDSPSRTARRPRSNGSSAQVERLVGRQSGLNGSPARLEQLVSPSQPVPDIRAARADAHWRSDRTRNQIHRQANEAPQNTRQALPRAPQAKSRSPWQTPFRKRKSSYRMLAARVSRKNQTPFDERGKSPIRWNHHVART